MSGAFALAQAAVDLERAAAARTKAQLRSAASWLEWQWTLLRDHPALHKVIETGAYCAQVEASGFERRALAQSKGVGK